MFKTLLADPPWLERGGGKVKRGADRHYGLLSKEKIVDVIRWDPLYVPDRSGCLFWLWATSNHLEDAFFVMRELGFSYITHFAWIKPRHGKPGIGQRSRQRHEHLLLGRMGTVAVPAPPDRPDSVIEGADAWTEADAWEAFFADDTSFVATRTRERFVDDAGIEQVREHSVKPEESYRRIERSSPGPRVELFARRQRPGWTVSGNQVAASLTSGTDKSLD